MLERWYVFFTGQVQGVGFRYTAIQCSKQHPITGWIQNLSDGRVQLLAEGKPRELQIFVDELCLATHGNVNGLEIQREQPSGEFHDFRVLT
ncbi:MAG: acylphosphatase [Planctomycetaceae bacterium]|nr:acylphosphatase [Planctomycetaceae bacterium]MCP4463019.1 acylphosphatase [Planctomycetaceae bacterium]MDG1809795.1 acylphosphatase [Pirellulaceae bacterium]MDG2102406.1 acylphosphatase [Pirellulaceae bacterium]